MNKTLWDKKEIEILINSFKNTPLQSKYSKLSKTKILQQILLKNGFQRSLISIRRKLYRLGLVDFKITREPFVIVNCSICNKKIKILNRYKNNYKHYCDVCREIKRKQWAKTDSGKLYHSQYLKKYRARKKQLIVENT